MNKKNYVVAIDLGSSKIAIAVAEKQSDGLLNVVSLVSKPVKGVDTGRIDNAVLVGQAIGEALKKVEKDLNIHITEAYAGISGEFVSCARCADFVFTEDPIKGVTQKDVDALFERVRNVRVADDMLIMDRIPQKYMMDDLREVDTPVGSFGKKLSSTFNFILCEQTPVKRLEMALNEQGIKLLDVLPDAIATAEAVLLPEEREEGVVMVDIGSGLTDVAVWYHNVVRYIASIPMGASAIDRDIRTWGIPEKYVENLKLQFGSAVVDLVPETKAIRSNGRMIRGINEIPLRNVTTVIEARATDIVEFVQQELKDSGYAAKLPCGIVLTGGSAKLQDLDELFRRKTGMEVRVAAATENGLAKESANLAYPEGKPKEGEEQKYYYPLADPANATVIGLLLQGAARGICNCTDNNPAPVPTPDDEEINPPKPRKESLLSKWKKNWNNGLSKADEEKDTIV